MGEHIQDKITFNQRLELTYKGVKNGGTEKYMAEQIEMAYLAGLNRLNLSGTSKNPIEDTGQAAVLARNYVIDKGYKK